ncbi:MAG TPA: NRDE family protein [Vicinamibacterales bacterium]|nr:NRDE family protein [Vicinamibacterales bacterium]
MCTASIVRSADGAALRMVMNRDERRLRPVAHPPAVRRTATGHAVWPTDPEGGGTWVAATDAGLVLLLLNQEGRRRSPELLSRGLIIPMLAGVRSIGGLADSWKQLDVTAFAPFRLVALTREQLAVFNSAERAPDIAAMGRAHVFASSSLGDAEAQSARGELFARLLRTEIDPGAAQTRFHQHAWPDRRHLSVMMSRVDACTVSQTEVVLTATSVFVTYRTVVDGWPVTTTDRALDLKLAASRAA